MKTETEFKHFYQTSLLGELKELEIKRLNAAARVRMLIIVELIIFIVILIYAIWFMPEKTSTLPGADIGRILLIAGCFIVLVFILVLASTRITRKYRRKYKENIIGRLVGQISEHMAFFPEDKIEYNEFKASRIFDNTNISGYTGKDLVTGKIGDINFRFSWLEVDSRTMPDQRTKSQVQPLFKGIFFVADFGTPFSTYALVYTDISRKFRLGKLGEILQKAVMGEKIPVDDPEFKREFNLYGDDPEKARKIVSPGIRQWIIDFKKKTGGMVFLSFAGTKLNIGVFLRKNLFEPPLFRKVENYDYILENFRYLLLFSGVLESIAKR